MPTIAELVDGDGTPIGDIKAELKEANKLIGLYKQAMRHIDFICVDTHTCKTPTNKVKRIRNFIKEFEKK